MSNHQKCSDSHDPGPSRRTSGASVVVATLALAVGFILFGARIGGARSSDASCDGAIQTYRLAEQGSYAAFARSPSGPTSLEVRGPSGELLTSWPSTASTPAAVDLPTARRFGVPAPHVFTVDSYVDLHVDSTEAPAELVLTRLGDSDEWSGQDVRPPVAAEPGSHESCPAGGYSQLATIRVDAVYSDMTARQVFIASLYR